MKVNGIEYGYAGIGGVGEGGRAHAQSAGRGDEDGRMERAPLLQRPLGSQSPNMRHSGSSCDHPLYSIESTVPVYSALNPLITEGASMHSTKAPPQGFA